MKSMSNVVRVGVAAMAAVVVFSGASIASAQSTNFSIGNKIVIVEAVKVRETPNGVHNNSQQRGAMGTVIGGPVVMGGYTWWNINYDKGADGWSAEDFMQLSTVALVTPGSIGQVAGVSTTANEQDVQATLNALKAQLTALIAQLAALQAQHAGHSM